MRSSWLRLIPLAALPLLLSSAARADETRWFSLDTPTQRIVGGEPVNACEWPTTALISGCTATLVHPRVVIYAAHCGEDQKIVRFTEDDSGGGRQAAVEACEVNPEYETKPGTDHAFCVLVDRHAQDDIPLVPVLMGCEADLLQAGSEVTLVGFGQDDNGTFGRKRKVTTTINSVSNEVSMGGGGKSSCFGDSGGPAYIKHPDGSWKVFGITSYGLSEECGGQAFYSVMHIGMPWIEQRLLDGYGIDITPCHDTDGTWNPGPDCREFPQDAGTGYGSWDDGCSGGPVGGWSSTCGPGFDEQGPDTDPPIVNILSPTDGERLDGETPMPIDVEVEADDGEGWGVESVRLVVDGVDIAESIDEVPPFEWTLSLKDGEHTIAAIATDVATNEGTSPDVHIGINVEVELPETGDTGDADADDGDKGGCGCAANTGSKGLWAAMLLALGLTRRRRLA